MCKCSICGKETSSNLGGNQWNENDDEIVETKIHLKEGKSDKSFIKTSVNLCDRCFREILMPALRKEGASFNEEEVELNG